MLKQDEVYSHKVERRRRKSRRRRFGEVVVMYSRLKMTADGDGNVEQSFVVWW